ncbi:hypothetical protein AB3N02_21910 [Priestia aryabhattai]|uniref:phage lytic cycle repressor MrpR family protein n=1 Tax=Priestia aryabhattai TaxID=412384 RepID=UPI0039A23130
MVATMTNERNNSLFDEDVKREYLEEMVRNGAISEATAHSYERIFHVTFQQEDALGKDLNQFTLEEMETILHSFEANNRNTVESYARIISSYLNWSVNNDFTAVNVLAGLKPSDFEKYLVHKEEYFTEKQLTRWESRCANYQDIVINRLLYIGVGGKQMSEIRNLTIDDVDFKNRTLTLKNTLKEDKETKLPTKYSERLFRIDKDDNITLEIIRKAFEQKKYIKKNGEMETNPHMRDYTELVKNNYIVRASITRTSNWNIPVDKYVIYRRIDLISESLGIKDFTAKFIQRSGMLHLASKLIGDGEISLDDLKIVAERYGIKSYHNLKGFLTTENIRKVYPLQEERI